MYFIVYFLEFFLFKGIDKYGFSVVGGKLPVFEYCSQILSV